jgi:hypothetical protein
VNKGRFLMLIIVLLLCASAPVTLLAVEVVSDTFVTVAIFNAGPSSIHTVTVASGDKEYSLGDLSSSQGQAVSARRVANGHIVVKVKGSEGQPETLFQLPSDNASALSIAVKEGKLQSFTITPRRKLWWR